MGAQRLDKIIASQLCISRSDARTGIRHGLARVNETVIRDAAFQLDPGTDQVQFNGHPVCYKEFIYIVMNKPRGVLSATQDKHKQTVTDLVPESMKRKNLFPVGRLDRDTTGLMIITDDGDFAHSVLSPAKNIYKTYKARLDGQVNDEMVKLFSEGVTLADGTLCRKAFLKTLPDGAVQIRICEGKYHQIKRMLGVVGLGVNELERTAIGAYTLPENLACGECAEVSKSDLKSLFADIL